MSSYGQQQHASSTRRFIFLRPWKLANYHRIDNVMQLNNWLQVNGGTRRLTWGEHRFGPEHCPLWRAAALSSFLLAQVRSFFADLLLQLIISNSELARAPLAEMRENALPTTHYALSCLNKLSDTDVIDR